MCEAVLWIRIWSNSDLLVGSGFGIFTADPAPNPALIIDHYLSGTGSCLQKSVFNNFIFKKPSFSKYVFKYRYKFLDVFNFIYGSLSSLFFKFESWSGPNPTGSAILEYWCEDEKVTFRGRAKRNNTWKWRGGGEIWFSDRYNITMVGTERERGKIWHR